MTRILIRGNSVLVPAVLTYGGSEINVHFLLDTGASGTVIHTSVADQLSIDMNRARKAMGEVVGGGMVEASVVRMPSLTVGPYTFHNRPVFIVPYEGHAARFDGLLGMDLLRELKYRVDFRRQIIIWD